MNITDDTSLYRFEEISYGDRPPSHLAAELISESLTGLIVHDFLSQREVSQVLEGLGSMAVEDKVKVNDGLYFHPVSFAQFTQRLAEGSMTEREYAELSARFREGFQRAFGVDAEERVASYVRDLFGMDTAPIYNTRESGHLLPFTFRELLPGKGELMVHCENFFFHEFPEYFAWLERMDVKDNKFSFFIVLQDSEEGGELCCYDLHWDMVGGRHGWEFEMLEDRQGNVIDVNDPAIRRMYVKPRPGDLLIFCGGNVWHRVERVRGTRSRITLGGFIAESAIPGRLILWS